jgi:hypothetical protein
VERFLDGACLERVTATIRGEAVADQTHGHRCGGRGADFGPHKIAMDLKRYPRRGHQPVGVWRILKRMDMNGLPATQQYRRHVERWKRAMGAGGAPIARRTHFTNDPFRSMPTSAKMPAEVAPGSDVKLNPSALEPENVPVATA